MNYIHRFELLLRYNYYVDLYPWRFFFIIFTPYIACIISLFIMPQEYRINFVPFFIIASIIIIGSMMLRQADMMFPLTNDSKRMEEVRKFFTNKWFIRGRNQYVYIKQIDDIHIGLYIYNPSGSFRVKEYNCGEFSYYKSYWGEWNLSTTIPASKQDIEKHNLIWLEAKILLGQENG